MTRTVANASFNTFAGANLDATGTSPYTGDGTSGIYIWGAQLEQRSTVTAYTPTTGPADHALPTAVDDRSGERAPD